MFILLPEA